MQLCCSESWSDDSSRTLEDRNGVDVVYEGQCKLEWTGDALDLDIGGPSRVPYPPLRLDVPASSKKKGMKERN